MMPSLEIIEARLSETLSAKRIEHIRRVAETARELAERHHLDPERALIAGMLHDLARETPPHVLLRECRERGIPIMPVDEVNPIPRLHGQLGAALAREDLGVTDPEVLDAIASHTLGRVGMSPLEMAVFLADYCEPGREPQTGLAEVRAAAREDLALATRMAMDYTIRYLIDKRRALHPQVVDARNWILTRAGQGVPSGGT